jgi:Protein of unknown function (DUF1631)
MSPSAASNILPLNMDSEDRPPLRPEEARALLRTCFARYQKQLREMANASLEMSGDLFESKSTVPDGEIEAFRQKQGEWLAHFVKSLEDLFELRLSGQRRKGRRPDADASARTLKILTAFDHEKQTALTEAAAFLARFTRRELSALDLRISELLEDGSTRTLDNPLSASYVLDALGSTSRAVYPHPGIWRPLMERLIADMTPGMNKVYISLNRMLADHGVLPEIKAALRARSRHRPNDDRELFATFSSLMQVTEQPVPTDVVVPDFLSEPGTAPALVFTNRPANSPAAPVPSPAPSDIDARAILAGLQSLAAAGTRTAGGDSTARLAAGPATSATTPGVPSFAAGGQDFPSLEPLMALGTSTQLFATLAQWQKLDLPAAIARLNRVQTGAGDVTPMPGAPTVAATAGELEGGSNSGVVLPMNLIPYIREAIAGQISNPSDEITMDVIALLFDYIFRDASIPEPLRALFGRLQVPVVKAGLLDRSFFSDRRHAARLFLDRLADAAIGSGNDAAYRAAFEQIASSVIDEICRDFEIDVAVFHNADARLAAFVERERRTTADAVSGEVAAALAAEAGESDRAEARAAVRDRLAGLDVPFAVRSFVETTWSEYLAELRRQHGSESEPCTSALGTLDEMLWSIVAKERSGQKARLTKMIPTLVGSLRKGAIAARVPPERAREFFEALYALHMAAIKAGTAVIEPGPVAAPPAAGTASRTADAVPATDAAAPQVAAPAQVPVVNVHDFVSEMAVGTWLEFTLDGDRVNARLSWASPLRTRYIFTSRSCARALAYTPEELAYELGSGKASLLVEPVPLWDRAVSAALDTLAARNPAAGRPAAASA